MNETLIYLASPYSSPDPTVLTQRFLQICAIAGDILAAGHLLYAPIAHSHPIAFYSQIRGQQDTSWATWQRLDELMITKCDEVWVVMLDGWRASVGIAAELSVARDRTMPIRYYDPVTKMVSETP
jgi:hypothetical protein